jgi:hypothetical protein
MRKVILGLLVALLVGVGGYFGAVHWAERTAAREVDARLDLWRSGGGSATRGPVRFDLWTRTLKVADVAITLPSSSDERISIDELIATGVEPSGRARRLDIVGLEVSQVVPGLAGTRMQQKAPRVTLTDFSERPVVPVKGVSPADATRRWLEQLSAIVASTIEAPSLTVTVTPAEARNRPAPALQTASVGAAEYTYSNLVLREVANGRIAEATIEKVVLRAGSGRTGPGFPGPGFTGEMANASVRDIDIGPMLAWLDPSRPRSEGYQRVYGQVAAGPYTVRLGDGTGLVIDRIVAEELGLYPARLSLEDLDFLMEVTRQGNAPPTAAQLVMLVDKMAGLYEGIGIGRLELLGLKVDTPREGIAIGSIAFKGLENGRLAEFSIEQLEAQKALKPVGVGGRVIEGANGRPVPGETVKVGRMGVRGFDIVKLLRTTSTQIASLGQRPGSPSQIPGQAPSQAISPPMSPAMALLGAIEGIELKDFAVPDPATGRMVHVEAFDAAWGKLVGGVPSEAQLSAKLSGPIGPTDPDAFIRALAGRGMASLTISLDLGARWHEAEQKVALAPAAVEIRDVLGLSIKASAGNVPREMLSTDFLKAMAAAPLVEAGPVELTLRDLGLVEVAAAQLGQTKGGDAAVGRALLVETLAQRAAEATQTAPELQQVFDALGRFVQGKGETLTVALTPKGTGVGLLQLIEAARRDPLAALLSNFTVEARTGG